MVCVQLFSMYLSNPFNLPPSSATSFDSTSQTFGTCQYFQVLKTDFLLVTYPGTDLFCFPSSHSAWDSVLLSFFSLLDGSQLFGLSSTSSCCITSAALFSSPLCTNLVARLDVHTVLKIWMHTGFTQSKMMLSALCSILFLQVSSALLA